MSKMMRTEYAFEMGNIHLADMVKAVLNMHVYNVKKVLPGPGWSYCYVIALSRDFNALKSIFVSSLNSFVSSVVSGLRPAGLLGYALS